MSHRIADYKGKIVVFYVWATWNPESDNANPVIASAIHSGIELISVASGPYLGDFEAGALAAATSVRVSVVSGGVACIAGCLLLAWRIPQFARYDAREPTP